MQIYLHIGTAYNLYLQIGKKSSISRTLHLYVQEKIVLPQTAKSGANHPPLICFTTYRAALH